MINSDHAIRLDKQGEHYVHTLNVYDEHRNLLVKVEVFENPATDKVTVNVEDVEERVSVQHNGKETPK